ncbi:hypothetical protein P353_04240 [Comamonas testosteroni]|uniref:Uncharacterized protein n=1 Tax=Comamonas testosteroni TaxID=285 RepID=A0A096FNV8_COMTE|nr:hypothetical protein P353_04240 [Comamonas testosteroni]
MNSYQPFTVKGYMLFFFIFLYLLDGSLGAIDR